MKYKRRKKKKKISRINKQVLNIDGYMMKMCYDGAEWMRVGARVSEQTNKQSVFW